MSKVSADLKITFRPSLRSLARVFGDMGVKEFLSNEVKRLAFSIEREAKPRVPVRSGLLKSRTRVWSLEPLRAEVGSRTDYAVYVHEGTRYMKARPYLIWGAQIATKDLDSKLGTSLDIMIDKQFQTI